MARCRCLHCPQVECASSYYRYGSALLYQAQENDDVLGAPLGGGGGGSGEDAGGAGRGAAT